MRVMGLDVGDRRIGIALGDPSGRLASPLTVLRRASRPSGKDDFQVLRQLAQTHEVNQIVVGLPRRLDGTLGTQAKKVLAFTRELEREVGLPVALWDEEFTTVEAERLLIEGGKSRRKRREAVDAAAAALILQSYLDRSQLS